MLDREGGGLDNIVVLFYLIVVRILGYVVSLFEFFRDVGKRSGFV